MVSSPASIFNISAAGLPKADVLIDVRNGYEHDIGHFDVPSSAGVKVLLPQTRTFAEMPAWFE